MSDIIKIIWADGRFTSLNQALTTAGMVDTLSGSGPFTLFAATDEAFGRALYSRDGQVLDRTNLDALTTMLTRHVVAEKMRRTVLTDGLVLPPWLVSTYRSP